MNEPVERRRAEMLTRVSQGIEVVQAKIDYARKQLANLKEHLRAFDQRAPWEITQFGDLDHAYLRLREPFDPEWEITVGTAAHQLRSALDRVITLMVITAGGSADEHHGQFPISSSRRTYFHRGKDGLTYRDRAMLGVPDEARRVVDGLQPFEDESHPLALLSLINNWDKHRDGQPAMSAQRNTAIVIRSEREKLVQIFGDAIPVSRAVHDGYDLRELIAEEKMREIRRLLAQLRERDPDASILLVPRIGVCFGRRGVFLFQLEEILEFVESRVVAPLAPHVAHNSSSRPT